MLLKLIALVYYVNKLFKLRVKLKYAIFQKNMGRS